MSRFITLPLLLGALSSAAAGASPQAALDALYPGAAEGQATDCQAQLAGGVVFIAADGRRTDGRSLCQALAGLSPRGGSERSVSLSATGDTAWFDERLAGLAGTTGTASGVLVLRDGRWLVTQYHLTVAPIQPATAAAAAQPAAATGPSATAEQGAPEKPPCRKLRHKTNKVANC